MPRGRNMLGLPGGQRLALHVLPDQFGHLEHIDLFLAAEDRFKLLVGVYHPSILAVLQAVLLDVGPEFLGDFGARHGLAADDRCQGFVRLYAAPRIMPSRTGLMQNPRRGAAFASD